MSSQGVNEYKSYIMIKITGKNELLAFFYSLLTLKDGF